MADSVKTAEYRLCRKFWDGVKLHGVGEIVTFPVGSAPKTAKLVLVSPPPLPKPEKAMK